MQIKNIKKLKDKVVIYYDDKKMDVFPSVYASHNLYKYKEIDEKEIDKIKAENKIEEFFLFASKKVMLASYSPVKMEELLFKKGANKRETKEVIKKLKKYDFLNEKKVVEDVISYCDYKHYGFYRILKMLRDRKISNEEIVKVEYNSNREQKHGEIQIKNLLEHFKNKNNSSRKNSVYAGLVRLGFDEDLSLELVNKFSNSNHNNEINVLKLDYQKCFSKYSRKYTGNELDHKITSSLLSKGYRLNDINYVKELRK